MFMRFTKAVHIMFTAMQVASSKHCGNKAWCIKQYGLMHSHLAQIENNKNVKTLTQACPQECPKGTSAFNGQLIHGILQFTMIIALCCTLHQHVNQDICCWKCVVRWITYLSTIKQNSNAINTMTAAPTKAQRPTEHWHDTSPSANHHNRCLITRMILPQVHLRKPCYDFSFL